MNNRKQQGASSAKTKKSKKSVYQENTTVDMYSSSSDGCDDIDTCNVCMENYGDNRRPRTLYCGHTFCTSCLKKLTRSGEFKCPECLRRYCNVSNLDFPINYALEEMITKFKKVHMSKLSSQSPSSPSVTELSNKLLCFMEDQMDNAEHLLKSSEDILRLMERCRTFTQERKGQHQELLPMIYELAGTNEEIIEALEAEGTILKELQAEGEVLKEELTSSLELVRENNSITTMTEVDQFYAHLENWSEGSRTRIGENKTFSLSDEVLTNTKRALNALSKGDEILLKDVSNPVTSLQVVEKNTFDSKGCHEMSIRRLTQMSGPTKNLVISGKVFSVQNHKESSRCARISFQGDKFFLHHLEDTILPSSSYIIQQSELMAAISKGPVRVFLDLAWGETALGQVHILLERRTPLARHFLALCTGEHGPSYAHCRFLEVAYKGHRSSEAVRTGDYEHNDGTGGAPVYPGIKVNDERYSFPLIPGIVWATHNTDDGSQLSQFSITTGCSEARDFKYQRVFGFVEKGLDVVRTATKVDDISNVKIVDCGIVLPFAC